MASDNNDKVIGLAGVEFIDLTSWEIWPYSERNDGKDPTQVHVVFNIGDSPDFPGRFIVRFKSARDFGTFQKALEKHGREVWGNEQKGGDEEFEGDYIPDDYR